MVPTNAAAGRTGAADGAGVDAVAGLSEAPQPAQKRASERFCCPHASQAVGRLMISPSAITPRRSIRPASAPCPLGCGAHNEDRIMLVSARANGGGICGL